MRYESLVEAKSELAEKQDRDLSALENARNDMASFYFCVTLNKTYLIFS